MAADEVWASPATITGSIGVGALMADRQAWQIVTFDDETQAPAGFAELAPAW